MQRVGLRGMLDLTELSAWEIHFKSWIRDLRDLRSGGWRSSFALRGYGVTCGNWWRKNTCLNDLFQ
jgi:hypothetical protein